MKKIRIGLLGLGQVGGGVYSILSRKKGLLAEKAGVQIEIAKILVRNRNKKRSVKAPRKLLTTRPADILRDPTIQVVVELTGGVRPTENWYYEAFRNGKDIVTANKALLAERGEKLFKAAGQKGRHIFFEASVGGGIPAIKSLREGLIANNIRSFVGIVNGTSNYILTQMSRCNMGFKDSLKLAQEQGFAEADPTFDIKGIDAAHKLALLIRLAFRKWVPFSSLDVRGVDSISQVDIDYARRFGFVIKLIAHAKENRKGLVAGVEPLLLKEDHILAKVDGNFNAILFKGDEVGDFLVYGQGAGSLPTASAVVSDLCDLALGRESRLPRAHAKAKSGLFREPVARYYLRFTVIDRPGVLASISKILGAYRASIADVIQLESKAGNAVPLIMVTHHSDEAAIEKAVAQIDRLPTVRGRSQKIRIED